MCVLPDLSVRVQLKVFSESAAREHILLVPNLIAPSVRRDSHVIYLGPILSHALQEDMLRLDLALATLAQRVVRVLLPIRIS